MDRFAHAHARIDMAELVYSIGTLRGAVVSLNNGLRRGERFGAIATYVWPAIETESEDLEAEEGCQ